jgi:hypothetical protein
MNGGGGGGSTSTGGGSGAVGGGSGAMGGGSGAMGGGSGAMGGGSGATGGGSGAMGGGSGAMGGGSGAMGGGTSSGYSCTTGTLFAGNPVNMDPMARPADGTMLLTDPPFPYRNIVFSNGQIITHDGQEIWRASLSDSKLHKVAGTESIGQALITGACSGARFANIFGIALASDGSLFVSDQTANTILKITHPLDSTTCSVAHWAGTPMDIPDDGTITPDTPPNVGNVEGPGAMAMFGLPERLAIDGSDNLYVWDNGNDSIRKIANDASHTVSTLVMNLGKPASVSEAFLNGNLYVWGDDGTNVFLNKVNPTTGASTTILSGGADKFGGGSGDALTVGGINVAGSNLVVFFNGQLFAITEAGVVSAPLAGVYQPGLDFSMGYDPAASHPAASVEMVSSPSTDATAGLEAWVAVDPSHNLYVSAVDINSYVEKIACSP